ncbi:MAG: hypothetical protein ACJ8IQ_08040 [Chthoniobacterales bacterium]
MRRALTSDHWEQIKTAYAAGVGLRELARNMNLPAGTVLARAKREGWTQQIQSAKQQGASSDVQSTAITPMQSVAVTMQQRGERHRDRIAGVTESVLPHLESLEPAKILSSARDLEQFDRVARRNYGLADVPAGQGVLNLAILTNQAAIQIVSPR